MSLYLGLHHPFIHQGPVPERRNNSIPGINVPHFRDNFIPGINSVPERRNSAIQGINLGQIYYTLQGSNKSPYQGQICENKMADLLLFLSSC